MANQEQLKIFKQGVKIWNEWRESNPDIENIDLSDYTISEHGNQRDLSGINLSRVNLTRAWIRNANLNKANLSQAILDDTELCGSKLNGANLTDSHCFRTQLVGVECVNSDLSRANLTEVNAVSSNFKESNLCNVSAPDAYFTQSDFQDALLCEARLYQTNLNQADFTNANLSHAELALASCFETNFQGANLTNASLVGATFVRTNFNMATINDTFIYGVSAWDVQKENLLQQNLIINDEPRITVDDIEVAQFMYLMLNNDNIRNVLGTIAKKGVLILGRFTPERKKILDAIREKLRELDFLPMMFDFEKVSSKDFTETIKVMAGMSRFVIADISNPSSSPLELQATLPDYKIPFVTIIEAGQRPFAMFQDLTIYPWCLDVISYESQENLIKHFKKGIIDRALEVESMILEQKDEGKRSPKNIKDL